MKDPFSPSQWVVRQIPGGQDPVSCFIEKGIAFHGVFCIKFMRRIGSCKPAFIINYIANLGTPRFLHISAWNAPEPAISLTDAPGQEVKAKLIKQFTCELDVVYATGKKSKLDIYYPKTNVEALDVLIFIHGGYWQAGSKNCHAFFGSHLNDLNCILVMVGYDFAPDVTMDDMVEQIRIAMIFTANKFPSSRLFLCGHSAGAHLSAMMMTLKWEGSGFSPQRMAGVFLLSGLYDLEPFLKTYVNDPIKMDKEVAVRNSPMQILQSHNLTIQCRVMFAIAEHDTPLFHQQSTDFCKLLKKMLPHHSVIYIGLPGLDHFDMIQNCVEKDFILIKEIANFMKHGKKTPL